MVSKAALMAYYRYMKVVEAEILKAVMKYGLGRSSKNNRF